jgi:hypothetical protein
MVKLADLQKGVLYTFSEIDEEGLRKSMRNPAYDPDEMLSFHRSRRNVPFRLQGVYYPGTYPEEGGVGYKVEFSDGTRTWLFPISYGNIDFKPSTAVAELAVDKKLPPGFAEKLSKYAGRRTTRRRKSKRTLSRHSTKWTRT